jgi:hypothetical protein
MATFDAQYCVLCDDVRSETTGKEILIGVYPVGITIPSMPWFVIISVWLRGAWSGEGEAQILVRIKNPKGIEVGRVSGLGKSVWRGFISSITLPGLAFQADMDGNYEVEVQIDGGEWKHILQFPIYFVSLTSSNASPQLS